MIPTLPNALTLGRVAAVPVIAALFFLDTPTGQWITLAIFTVAAITDFLDGYIVRRYDQHTEFGRFLDPIADKLLIATTLMMMVAFGQIAGLAIIPAVVILCREILVSGLREYLAGIDVGLPVSWLARWKTAIQMIALGFLIIGDAAHPPVPEELPVRLIGEAGLWIAALITLFTGFDYMRIGLRHMDGPTDAQ